MFERNASGAEDQIEPVNTSEVLAPAPDRDPTISSNAHAPAPRTAPLNMIVPSERRPTFFSIATVYVSILNEAVMKDNGFMPPHGRAQLLVQVFTSDLSIDSRLLRKFADS